MGLEIELNNAVAVKVSFNTDLRRFSISRDATYAQLLASVVQLCSIDPSSKLVIKYADSESEEVTMSSDLELKEAIRGTPTVLRLFVSLPSATRAVNNTAAPSTDMDIEDVSGGAPALFPMWGWGGRGGMGGRGGGFGGRGGGFMSAGGRGGGFGPRGGPHGPHPHHPHPFFPGGGRGGRGGAFGHPGHHEHPHHAGPHDHPHHAPGAAYEHHKPGKDMRKEWKQEKCEWKKELKSQWKEMSKEDRQKAKEEMREQRKLWKQRMHESSESEGGCRRTKLVARHVKDVTISDGTELPAGSRFVKTWRVRNDGLEAWPPGCRLLWISRKGDRMGAPEEGVALTDPGNPIAPETEVEISVELTAPAEPGRYTSYWRMATPDGAKFGQRMWASITVAGSSSSCSSSDDDESRFGGLATMIEAMGFEVKRKHILRLLAKKDGDADKVVKILSKREKGCKGQKSHKH